MLGAPFVQFWTQLTHICKSSCPASVYTICFTIFPTHNGLTHWWLFEKHSAILCIWNEIEHKHIWDEIQALTLTQLDDCARIKKFLSSSSLKILFSSHFLRWRPVFLSHRFQRLQFNTKTEFLFSFWRIKKYLNESRKTWKTRRKKK